MAPDRFWKDPVTTSSAVMVAPSSDLGAAHGDLVAGADLVERAGFGVAEGYGIGRVAAEDGVGGGDDLVGFGADGDGEDRAFDAADEAPNAVALPVGGLRGLLGSDGVGLHEDEARGVKLGGGVAGGAGDDGAVADGDVSECAGLGFLEVLAAGRDGEDGGSRARW